MIRKNLWKSGELLEKRKKQKKYLLFGGLILIALSIAVGILLFSLQYEELWWGYSQARIKLSELEETIVHLDNALLFTGAVMLLFAVKSFFPIYATSTVCFLTGVVLPMYVAIPVNVLGFIVLITIHYYWGKRFGAGNAWKMITKVDVLRKLIQQDGKGNPALLIALRLVPGMPVNSISGIYGSFNFEYWRFVLLSVIGFMPKLISFTFVGRNVYDPLSPGFLLPIMILLFISGVSVLSVNGVWTSVEKTVEYVKNKNMKKLQKKGNIKNDENS